MRNRVMQVEIAQIDITNDSDSYTHLSKMW